MYQRNVYIDFLQNEKITLSNNLTFYTIYLQMALHFIESVVLNQKVILVMYTPSVLMYFNLVQLSLHGFGKLLLSVILSFYSNEQLHNHRHNK